MTRSTFLPFALENRVQIILTCAAIVFPNQEAFKRRKAGQRGPRDAHTPSRCRVGNRATQMPFSPFSALSTFAREASTRMYRVPWGLSPWALP